MDGGGKFTLLSVPRSRFLVAITAGAMLAVVAIFAVALVRSNSAGAAAAPKASFTLDFAPRSIAFDPVRPYMYAVDQDAAEIVFVNLQTGQIDRRFGFDQTTPTAAP